MGGLPRKVRDDGETDLYVDLYVDEGRTWEGRAMEALEGGYCVRGWREVVKVENGEEVVKAEEWVHEKGRLERVTGGEIIDRKCVRVVEGVWGMTDAA